MSHIFISYSHKDKEYVHKLHDALVNEGFDVWIDDRIDYGDKWLKAIEKNLDECDAFIIVMSKNSSESEMVQNEITRARDLEKQIFPLLLDGKNWLVVQARQFVDVRDGSLPTEKFYRRLEAVTPRKNERAEHAAAESVAQEQAKREDVEKAKRDSAQGQVAQKVALKETFSTSLATLKSNLPKAMPFLRVAGFASIIVGIFWFGSWATPKLIPLMVIRSTSTFYPSITSTSMIFPTVPTSTQKPTSSPTKTRTRTPTVTRTPTLTPTHTLTLTVRALAILVIRNNGTSAVDIYIDGVKIVSGLPPGNTIQTSVYPGIHELDECPVNKICNTSLDGQRAINVTTDPYRIDLFP